MELLEVQVESLHGLDVPADRGEGRVGPVDVNVHDREVVGIAVAGGLEQRDRARRPSLPLSLASAWSEESEMWPSSLA